MSELAEDHSKVNQQNLSTSCCCQICQQPDTSEMVQCDDCNLWQHFDCVGVGSSIADKEFLCPSCRAHGSLRTSTLVEDINADDDKSKASSSLSRKSAHKKQLKMRQLEEELSLSREYLRKKYEMLTAESDNEFPEIDRNEKVAATKRWLSESSNTPLHHGISTVRTGSIRLTTTSASASTSVPVISKSASQSQLPSVLVPLVNSSEVGNVKHVKITGEKSEATNERLIQPSNSLIPPPFYPSSISVPSVPIQHSSLPPVIASTSNVASTVKYPVKTAETVNPVDRTPAEFYVRNQIPVVSENTNNIAESNVNFRVAPPGNNFFTNPTYLSNNATIPINYQPRITQSAYYQEVRHPQSLSYVSNNVNSLVNNQPRTTQSAYSQEVRHPQSEPTSYESNNILNARQLAARHVVSKDLPIFGGNPIDWPIFISSYEATTSMCGFSDEENLIRLQRCLKGRALESVRSRMLLPNNVKGVISTLRLLYGRPEVVINSLLEDIRNQTSPKAEHLDSIIKYALSVQNLCSTIEASGLLAHISNPMLLQELVDKLPAQIRLNWAMFKKTIPVPSVISFGNWLFELAQAASDVTPHLADFGQDKSEKRSNSKKDKGYLHAHSEQASNTYEKQSSKTTDEKPKECIICLKGIHKVEDCIKFKQYSLSDKWKAVKQNALCRRCLGEHYQWKCKVKSVCGKNGCAFRHHQLLHNSHKDLSDTQSLNSTPTSTSHYNCHTVHKSNIMFRVIPIMLYGRDTSIKTHAFLDEGSSLTLMEDGLADDLNLSGVKQSLCLKWTADDTRTEPESRRVSMEVSGTHKHAPKYKLSEVRTVSKLNLPIQSWPDEKTCREYAHLKGIPLEPYYNVSPRILIGIDNWRLGAPLKIKEGKSNQPVASKTRLGWLMHGLKDESGVHETFNLHMCECNSEKNLHELVKYFFSLESVGVKVPEQIYESRNDKRALEILKSSTHRENGKFETSLLWKFENITLPDSYPMAFRRFLCLERQMKNDAELQRKMHHTINEYVMKGYVRKLTKEELATPHPRIWYLPIFSVKNPNKPGKFRVVWDAAAKSNGTSLNSALLKGPDQLTSLLGVMFRFRERLIAVTGDIREMFHQIKIRKDDQNAQRFLWRDSPGSKHPDTYVMQVMTFGATCSPSAAQFVKNLNAIQFDEQFPRAVSSIVNNHYVDDMLDSADSIDEAIDLTKTVKYIHQAGGFEMRNWASNSRKVLAALGDNLEQKSKNLSINAENGIEKTLGMWWCTSSDTLTFSSAFTKINSDIINGSKRPTKREVLRILMSIYDPLGLLAPYLVYIKILLQEIWRSQLEWDDELTNNLQSKWMKWVEVLPSIQSLRIPRCYSRVESTKHTSIQLHVFVDAGEDAYAAAAYLRIESENDLRCSLVIAKTKVAPLKPLSIPRLELQAAVIGARLAKSVGEEHTLPIDKRYIWTDSKTVLCWITSDPKKYRQYVAYRIAEILEITDVKEWKWVPSKLNVADEATKWSKIPEINECNRWFQGPSFLYNTEDLWPSTIIQASDSGDEMRPVHLHTVQTVSNIVQLDRFSKWLRLLRCMSYVFRFVHNLRAKMQAKTRSVGPLIADELSLAQNYLIKLAQSEEYSDEVSKLESNRNQFPEKAILIPKTSRIYNRSPYLDDCNILRVQGRIDAAVGISYDTKRPIILPNNHRITHLLLDHYHRSFHHHNQETVINEVRQRYDLPRLRSVLKSIVRSCQWCKNQKAKPIAPEMSSLPAARLAAFTPPFTFVGVDYFGPFRVSVGRRSEKRWGVLFTCLTIRAIHIEIAHSLTTDSCIMAIRNFSARRGTPQEIFSDNGTNFRGADEELRLEIKNMNMETIQERTFPSSKIKWNFNPPSAPHMGGCWERLIRSVKTTLKCILPAGSTSDEVLRNLLIEVENIVNSRPLTYMPLETNISEALTPNHFLLGRSNGEKLTGELNDHPLHLRRNWKISQQLADHFWKRWIREYLPDLTRRTKWYHRTEPIKVGDIVIIVDNTQPRNIWKKGIILETTGGRTGQVRQAVVQTESGVLTRPAVKLAVLDVHKPNV